ncbi:MAG TPA: hypothetical protein PK743_00020 [Luteimonas sp.]|nr:hypothetical protein [Luteimonas sp.]HRP71009.1 hypothetical protein [Luteimonas sp.]
MRALLSFAAVPWACCGVVIVSMVDMIGFTPDEGNTAKPINS